MWSSGLWEKFPEKAFLNCSEFKGQGSNIVRNVMLKIDSETYILVELDIEALTFEGTQGESDGDALSGELRMTWPDCMSLFCSASPSLRNEVEMPSPRIRPAFIVDISRRSFDGRVPGILDGPAT